MYYICIGTSLWNFGMTFYDSSNYRYKHICNKIHYEYKNIVYWDCINHMVTSNILYIPAIKFHWVRR